MTDAQYRAVVAARAKGVDPEADVEQHHGATRASLKQALEAICGLQTAVLGTRRELAVLQGDLKRLREDLGDPGC